MAFWNHSKNAQQKHSIIEVIKHDETSNDVLVLKWPHEDFNTNTQLIVGPAQEAIFVKGGQVLERFTEGTYVLDTKNYPFVRSLVGLVTGGVSPFSCTVYFVNKAVSMGIQWGTDTPISIIDPHYNVPVDIRSYGDFSLKVENGRKLIEKLIGQSKGFSHQEVQQFFGTLIATQIRGVISRTMKNNNLSTVGIDEHLPVMSAAAFEEIKPIFETYGMSLIHFTVAAITAGDLDSIKQTARNLQKRRMETDMAVEEKAKMAQAQAFENRELNVTEQQKMAAQMGKSLAENPGPIMGGMVGAAFPGMMVSGAPVQPSAAGTADIARMLMEQSASPAQSPAQNAPQTDPFEERIRKLNVMRDNGAITQEKYDEKIAEILNSI